MEAGSDLRHVRRALLGRGLRGVANPDDLAQSRLAWVVVEAQPTVFEKSHERDALPPSDGDGWIENPAASVMMQNAFENASRLKTSMRLAPNAAPSARAIATWCRGRVENPSVRTFARGDTEAELVCECGDRFARSRAHDVVVLFTQCVKLGGRAPPCR
jgi:hypothetical protein